MLGSMMVFMFTWFRMRLTKEHTLTNRSQETAKRRLVPPYMPSVAPVKMPQRPLRHDMHSCDSLSQAARQQPASSVEWRWEPPLLSSS